MNEENIIRFEGPTTEEEYRGPNIHDIDPYDALARSILSYAAERQQERVRKLPESIKIKNDKTIEFTLNSDNPYCSEEKLFKSRIVRLKYGLNVLVGPNGSGKSTILRNLREDFDHNNYTIFNYDNLHDGGSNSVSKAAFMNNIGFMSSMLTSSEGEGIMNNLGLVANAIGKFITFSEKEFPNEPIFILLDAVDSGLSINNIEELKDLFDIICNDSKDVVIVASCNTYTMTVGSYCWDVKNSKSISFKDYQEYHDYICNNSR